MPRFVKNHSTFIEGFEKLLKRLSKTSSKIKLITPGRIYRTSSNHQGTLELRITNHMKDTSSFKLLARKQSLVQELFIVSNEDISSTSLLQNHLQREIGAFCCIKRPNGNSVGRDNNS